MNSDKDKIFDENLKALGKVCQRPRDADARQVNRWIELAHTKKRPFILTFPMRSWFKAAGSLAAAALVFIAILAAFRLVNPDTLSARELSGMVDYTLSSKPVVKISVKNLRHLGHNLDLDVFSSHSEKQAYTKLRLYPDDPRQIFALDMDLGFTAADGSAWLLIQRFGYNSRDFLANINGGKSPVIVRLPVEPGAMDMINRKLPVIVEFKDIQAFVDSLESAVPQLHRSKLPDGNLQFEGKLLYPEKLSLSSLEKSVNALRLADRICSEAINKADYEMVQKMAELASAEMFSSYQKYINTAQKHQQAARSLGDLIRNSTLRVVYNPDTRIVKKITLGHIGASDGEFSFDFEACGYRSDIFDFQKTMDRVDAREITTNQLVFGIIRGLISPKGN